MKYRLLLILGVFFVSFAAIFIKLIDIAPSVIAMYRLGIGGVILLPFAFKNKDLSKLNFRDFKLIIFAAVMISLHYLSWFTSLRITSVTSSTLIICSQPLIAIAIGYLLYREKISPKQFLVLMISITGVAIVAWGDVRLSKNALIGDALTFIAVIFFVIYFYIGQNVVKKYSFIIYTSFLFLIATLILFIYNLIMGYEMLNYPPKIWIYLILIALIPNTGQVIFNYTLQYLKSSTISTSILLEPIFATILAVIILKDPIYTNHYIGGSIILASVYIYIKIDHFNVKAK